MTAISDIFSLIILSALVAGTLTYLFYGRLQRALQGLKHALLPARYLKKANKLRRAKKRRSESRS